VKNVNGEKRYYIIFINLTIDNCYFRYYPVDSFIYIIAFYWF